VTPIPQGVVVRLLTQVLWLCEAGHVEVQASLCSY